MKNKESRILTPEQAEARANKEKRTIEGYAVVFNSPSVLIDGHFIETILPGAIDGVIPRSDILALLDHDKSKGVLARSKYGEGTLALTADYRGLKYRFEAPKTALGDETLEGVRRGDIVNSSFAFTVAANGESWEMESDGTYHRTISQLDKIFDVSPVYSTEAYADTTVAVRSLKEFRGIKPLSDTLTEYYDSLDSQMRVVEKGSLAELNRYFNILDYKMKYY